MTKLPKHEKSSGNIFADLGLENADELLLNAQIMAETERPMKQNKPRKKKPQP
jgi:predicted XRE-type DNA-binding protein